MKRIAGATIAAAARDIISPAWETITLLRPTRTSDNKGGWTSTWSVVGSGAGRLAAMSGGALKQFEGELGSSRGFVLTAAKSLNVKHTDRVRVRGITVEIIADIGTATTTLARRFACREVSA